MNRLEDLHIRLTKEEREELDEMAELGDISRSDIVRNALRCYRTILEEEVGKREFQKEKMKWWR